MTFPCRVADRFETSMIQVGHMLEGKESSETAKVRLGARELAAPASRHQFLRGMSLVSGY
jgi:hypothetical protein